MNNLQTGTTPLEKLVVAVSSRALFNLDESHAIFENMRAISAEISTVKFVLYL